MGLTSSNYAKLVIHQKLLLQNMTYTACRHGTSIYKFLRMSKKYGVREFFVDAKQHHHQWWAFYWILNFCAWCININSCISWQSKCQQFWQEWTETEMKLHKLARPHAALNTNTNTTMFHRNNMVAKITMETPKPTTEHGSNWWKLRLKFRQPNSKAQVTAIFVD